MVDMKPKLLIVTFKGRGRFYEMPQAIILRAGNNLKEKITVGYVRAPGN
jgi:hypothetical protein